MPLQSLEALTYILQHSDKNVYIVGIINKNKCSDHCDAFFYFLKLFSLYSTSLCFSSLEIFLDRS